MLTPVKYMLQVIQEVAIVDTRSPSRLADKGIPQPAGMHLCNCGTATDLVAWLVALAALERRAEAV
jgi:hypothetical protein